MELFQLGQNVAWFALALVSVRLYRRARTPSAAWVVASFVSLAVVIWVGFALEQAFPDQDPPFWTIRLLLAVLMFFPYALYRFAGTFEVDVRPIDRVAAVATGVLVTWSLVLPDLPAEGEPYTAASGAYIAGLVAVWVGLLVIVAGRLWRGGRGQPTLVRRRMRLLSSSSLLLAFSLIGSAAQGSGRPSDAYTVFSGALSLLTAALFYVAFSPPPTLRAGWRQPEETELNAAAVQLMGATTPSQVTSIVLPHVSRLLGASGVSFHDRDDVLLGSVGTIDDADGDVTPVHVQLTFGELRIGASRYTPFFGQEELALASRLGVLADLAIARTQLLTMERATRSELESTNEELEAFVYSASHDLKSPLIAMLGYLEVLQEEAELDDGARWYVERMQVNGAFMQELIGDLLELSRVGRVDTELSDVDPIAILGDIGVEAERRFPALRLAFDPDLPLLRANPTRLRQLLTNLIENAAKHGGRDDLTVRVFVAETSAGSVTIGCDDDGRGIPDAYHEKVFGVFERLDATEAEGTGIGLAVSRKIARSAGGDLWLEPIGATEPTRTGARFRLRLELPEVAAAPGTPVATTTVPDEGQPTTAALSRAQRIVT